MKVVDLIETVIFVLRKKQNQVSYLHVYHHASTVIVTYITVKYVAGGMFSLPVIANTLIHIIMYSYYLLSSLKITTSITKIVKPHITHMQIVINFLLF